MPTYTYECKKHGNVEIYQPINDEALTRCPEKGCRCKVKRIIPAGVFIGALPTYMSDDNINSRVRHREWLGSKEAKAMDLVRVGDEE